MQCLCAIPQGTQVDDDALYMHTYGNEPVQYCFAMCVGAGANALEQRVHGQSGQGAAAHGLHLHAAAPTCLSQDQGELQYLHGSR